jgi:hypothetical protein
MSRNKDQGTAWQRELIQRAHKLGYEAWPLAEGGTKDAGDLAIRPPNGDTYIVEAKATQALSPHPTLRKALDKVEQWGENYGFIPAGVAVAWKRLLPTPGGKRRTIRGTRDGVFITTQEWLELIGR